VVASGGVRPAEVYRRLLLVFVSKTGADHKVLSGNLHCPINDILHRRVDRL
jgi:hypothetical protein